MGNRLHDTTHAREARLRKAMIRPEDALEAVSKLSAPGEALHALIGGDFIFAICFPPQPSGRIDVATLSLSVANIGTLKSWYHWTFAFTCFFRTSSAA